MTKEVVHIIRKADVNEINDLIMAVLCRYRELYPEEEIHFLSLPLDGDQRELELKRILEMHAMHDRAGKGTDL